MGTAKPRLRASASPSVTARERKGLAAVPLGQLPCLQCLVAPVRGLLRDFQGNLLETQTVAVRPQWGAGTPGSH